jgi:DNA polymerase-3 subunit epsilon
MNFILSQIKQLFSAVSLTTEEELRFKTWRRLPSADLTAPFSCSRYVVVDVESTGLDLNNDHLIAIGAVAVINGRIDLADSFEVVLRQKKVSNKENILIHGIGGEAQREGVKPSTALLSFISYLGKSPLIAFHVTFDETMIRRAFKQHLGRQFKHPWLDLAFIMPALLPDLARHYRALDDWSKHFEIANFARHSALADALATAQLLLCALPLTKIRQANHYRDLQAIEKAHRWSQWGG